MPAFARTAASGHYAGIAADLACVRRVAYDQVVNRAEGARFAYIRTYGLYVPNAEAVAFANTHAGGMNALSAGVVPGAITEN